ncbi:MAG: PadR family transcriptional regulator [Vulcanimicrobiota bacterium]
MLKKKGETHGYSIIDELNQHSLTDSVIDPGALYRTLRQLEENRCVESSWDVSGTGPAKRTYKLTDDGEKHLEEWLVLMENLALSLEEFTREARKEIK